MSDIRPLARDATEPMPAWEARDCIDRIRGHFAQARGLVVELHRREGWRALGYESWRACVVAEFAQSQAYLYRQLEAGYIEERISPMGEIGTIPERQLRELAPLAPQLQPAAWERAAATAPNGKVTAAHVEETVRALLPKTCAALDAGDPAAALAALDVELPPAAEKTPAARRPPLSPELRERAELADQLQKVALAIAELAQAPVSGATFRERSFPYTVELACQQIPAAVALLTAIAAEKS